MAIGVLKVKYSLMVNLTFYLKKSLMKSLEDYQLMI